MIKYRNIATTQLGERNYSRAFGACYAINAALPEKYQIHISTEQYEEAVKTNVLFVCGKCKIDCNKNDVKILELLLVPLQNLIINEKVEKVWFCTGCGAENVLARTEMKQTKLVQPSYTQIVPEPPQRRDGMLGRLDYHNKAEQWVWLCLEELEYALTTYRDDYMKANKAEFELTMGDDDLV